jgi:hypothetical protein
MTLRHLVSFGRLLALLALLGQALAGAVPARPAGEASLAELLAAGAICHAGEDDAGGALPGDAGHHGPDCGACLLCAALVAPAAPPMAVTELPRPAVRALPRLALSDAAPRPAARAPHSAQPRAPPLRA